MKEKINLKNKYYMKILEYIDSEDYLNNNNIITLNKYETYVENIKKNKIIYLFIINFLIKKI